MDNVEKIDYIPKLRLSEIFLGKLKTFSFVLPRSTFIEITERIKDSHTV